jgi:hypothetical protein
MTRLTRILCGVLLCLAGCANVAFAQSASASVPLPDLLNSAGLLAGGTALIAWGRQSERIKSNARRLDTLEEDRVTRPEFETMGTNIRNIESDIRQVREMLERRQLKRD